MANVAFAPRVHIAHRKSDVGRVNGPVRLGKDDDRLDTSGLFNLTLSRIAFGCPGKAYDELAPVEGYLPDFSPQVTDALGAPYLQQHAGKFPAYHKVCPGYRSEHMSSCYTPPHNFYVRNSEARSTESFLHVLLKSKLLARHAIAGKQFTNALYVILRLDAILSDS